MPVRSHVDFFATLTPELVSAVSAEEGRAVSRDETAARITKELKSVIERWTAYGVWVERVNSGAWLKGYQNRKDIEAHARPIGMRSKLHRRDSLAKKSASLKAYWASLTPEEKMARRRTCLRSSVVQ